MKEKEICVEVSTQDLSRVVQEIAFKYGWKWHSGKAEVLCTDSPYLFFDKKDKTMQYGMRHDEGHVFTLPQHSIEVVAFLGGKVKIKSKIPPKIKLRVNDTSESGYTLYTDFETAGKLEDALNDLVFQVDNSKEVGVIINEEKKGRSNSTKSLIKALRLARFHLSEIVFEKLPTGQRRKLLFELAKMIISAIKKAKEL